MGFEQISVIDGDTISETDLERQSLYSRNDLGFYKADTCRKKIEKLNGLKNVVSYNVYLESFFTPHMRCSVLSVNILQVIFGWAFRLNHTIMLFMENPPLNLMNSLSAG